MTVYNYTTLADLCDEGEVAGESDKPHAGLQSDGAAADLHLFRSFPRWRSFAQWTSREYDVCAGAGGLIVRLSPTWWRGDSAPESLKRNTDLSFRRG